MSKKKKSQSHPDAQHLTKQLTDHTSLETLFLPTFNCLKECLYDVIKTQAGIPFFEIFETVLEKAHACRAEKNNDFSDLTTTIQSLSNTDCGRLIKSLNLFFQLSNLAEDHYRDSVNQARRHDATTLYPNTLRELVAVAKKNNIDRATFLAILEKIDLSLVWTAHPTETTTMSQITRFQALIDCLQDLDKPHFKMQLTDQIKRHITLLWQSDALHQDRIHVLDEIRRNLYYIETTLIDVVPRILDDFAYQIAETYNLHRHEIELPPFLFFNLWSGGDRDGNPYVTAQMTQYALCLQRRTILRAYLNQINILLKDFSLSSDCINISQELAQNLKTEALLFPQFSEISQRLNPQEPYRRKCDFMRIKCEHNLALIDHYSESIGLGKTLVGYSPSSDSLNANIHYASMNDLLADCYLIKHSLNQHHSNLVSLGSLQKLIDMITTFEKLYLDIRQHAQRHKQCIHECFQHIKLNPSTKTYNSLLYSELINPRPMGYKQFFSSLSQSAQEVFNTLELIRDPQACFSETIIRSYIISMTQSTADIYGLMLLFKDVGLLQISNKKVTLAMLDIVPLFETLTDLNNAESIMEHLFNDSLYRSYLQKRQNIQEIMLGYSDSNKDVGPLCSQITLLDVQERLLKLAKKHGITLRFFHGRGGSISRGGGPMNESIRALPSGTLSHLKITEQGEKISLNYLNKGIAYRHLEQVIHAVVYRHIHDDFASKKPQSPMKKDASILNYLSQSSRETYEELVKHHPDFNLFFHDVTPIDLIEYSTIGSRPSKRIDIASKDTDLTTVYRAIPWVFSWMQTRLLISGFYGIGTALEKTHSLYGRDRLQHWYQTWPFFYNIMQNLQMVLLKANMPIAQCYLSLANHPDKALKIFELIIHEFELCKKNVSLIINNQELMYKTPKIRDRILRRNPFVDPLNILQIQLLHQWRTTSDLNKKSILLTQLGETINGITAGVRNFG